MRIPQTYTQTEGGVVNIAFMIEFINNLDFADYLSVWENEFVEDIYDSFTIRQKATNWLSGKQIETIERIYKKLSREG